MNEYLFFTLEGATLPPIEGKEVENCQLLGKANGKTLKEAKSNLLKENPWIEECGFDCDCIIAEQILTEEQKKDIQTLVEYLYEDEKSHYIEWRYPKDHIFRVIKRLSKMIVKKKTRI